MLLAETWSHAAGGEQQQLLQETSNQTWAKMSRVKDVLMDGSQAVRQHWQREEGTK